MITRYEPSMQFIGTGEYVPCNEPCIDGEYVLYEDHLAELSSLRLKLEAAEKDAARLDYLDSLTYRESCSSDIHFCYGNSLGHGKVSLYVRTVTGRAETSAHGRTVREAIDEALRTIQVDREKK